MERGQGVKKTLVISAISLRTGGMLSILQDCIHELNQPEWNSMKVFVLVRDRRLIGRGYEHINFIELDGTRSYLSRLYFEYFYFAKLAKDLNPDLWLSLHDITPGVGPTPQAVYCHNPSPFYKISFREFMLEPRFGLFTAFYWLLYKKNLRRNVWVIVQQSWMRTAFSKKFRIPESKIIVSHPNVFFKPARHDARADGKKIFFYPALPRVYKNIELIGEAVSLLQEKHAGNFEVIITVSGDETRYARWVKQKYGHLPGIRWIGLQTREDVFKLYTSVDFLIFPSFLETWGLPISEFKQTGKPLLLADLPYARETAGEYAKTIFFDPADKFALARQMEMLMSGEEQYSPSGATQCIAEPLTEGWASLFRMITPAQQPPIA